MKELMKTNLVYSPQTMEENNTRKKKDEEIFELT